MGDAKDDLHLSKPYKGGDKNTKRNYFKIQVMTQIVFDIFHIPSFPSVKSPI